MSLQGVSEDWVLVQKKTFTKWTNSHLRRKGYPALNDAEIDFETGINLINLINSLYHIELPKFNKNPRLRPHKLDNISLGFTMLDKAQVKTNFLKPSHLVDHDLKMILGMVWAIILDYQIKGISVEELTAKEGLLLWCQKKTAGYRDVNIENFTTSWQSGLGFCALIHKHRPDLLKYDDLEKGNAEHNLTLAFSVAEQYLGIPPLLDVEDLTRTARPDERSVMTYVSEYFHAFASQDLKEASARRIQKFVKFAQSIEEMQQHYEGQANILLSWIEETIARLNNRSFGNTAEQAHQLFEEHKYYLITEKGEKLALRLDLESQYAQIQTKLKVYGRTPYSVPDHLSPEDMDLAWDRLSQAEKERGKAVRDNVFRFITKATSTITPDQLAEFEKAFSHFAKDDDHQLARLDFKACLSSLSIPFKDEEAFNKVFNRVSGGSEKISKDQFIAYMIDLTEDKDTPDQIKESFRTLADHSEEISEQQLRVPPLSTQEVEFLVSHLPKSEHLYDYVTYVDQSFANQ